MRLSPCCRPDARRDSRLEGFFSRFTWQVCSSATSGHFVSVNNLQAQSSSSQCTKGRHDFRDLTHAPGRTLLTICDFYACRSIRPRQRLSSTSPMAFDWASLGTTTHIVPRLSHQEYAVWKSCSCWALRVRATPRRACALSGVRHHPNGRPRNCQPPGLLPLHVGATTMAPRYFPPPPYQSLSPG